jgi:hypothetical protein
MLLGLESIKIFLKKSPAIHLDQFSKPFLINLLQRPQFKMDLENLVYFLSTKMMLIIQNLFQTEQLKHRKMPQLIIS